MTRHTHRWTAQEAAQAAIRFECPATTGPVEETIQEALKRVTADTEREKLVAALLQQLSFVGLADYFVREYRFHVERKWRLDLYCDNCDGKLYSPLAIELHGGIFTGGRHTRGRGFTADREKMNAAVEAGIRVLEYTPKEIADGSALAQIERLITRDCAGRAQSR